MTGLARIVRGFTLLEVMVALAILALGLGALWTGLSQATVLAEGLPERVAARWVAQNRIILRQARQDWPEPGVSTGSGDMGGRTWYWQEQISYTREPLLRRIVVRVGRQPESLSLTRIEAYLQRPRPPVLLPGHSGSGP